MALFLLAGCGDSGNPRPTETTAPPSPSTSPVTLPETEPATEPEAVDEAVVQWRAAMMGSKPGQTLTLTLEQDGEEKSYSMEYTTYGHQVDQMGDYFWRGATEEDYRAAVPQEEYGVSYTISISCGEKSAPWTLTLASGADYAKFTWEGGTYYLGGAAEYIYGRDSTVSMLLRRFYDDMEYEALAEGVRSDNRIFIPDEGQSLEDAILAACYKAATPYTEACHGSGYEYKDVSFTVEIDEEETRRGREEGRLDDNTYCFTSYIIFVPANEHSASYMDVGHNRPYEGDNPEIPEGAYTRDWPGRATWTGSGWEILM